MIKINIKGEQETQLNSKSKIKAETFVMDGCQSDDYESILELKDLILVEFEGGKWYTLLFF